MIKKGDMLIGKEACRGLKDALFRVIEIKDKKLRRLEGEQIKDF